MIVPHPVSRLFRSASDRASLTFHDLKHDDAPASPSPSLLPSLFPRKEDAHCSPPARPCYLFTNSEGERASERRTVDDHRSATRYSFYVLWLNQPGYMRTLCPGQRDKLKKWRVIVDEITWKRITPRCWGVAFGHGDPPPLPLAAEISRNLIERRRERQWRFTDKLSSLPNEG